MGKNCLMCPTNCLVNKRGLSGFQDLCFFCLFFVKGTLCTNTAILPKTWDRILKNSFSQLFFFFLCKSSNMSRLMCKLCIKLPNAMNNPPWGPIFILFFLHSPPSSEMPNLFRSWHLKGIEEKNHGFEKSGALQITILQKVNRCVAF